jgi:hypothetical protein
VLVIIPYRFEDRMWFLFPSCADTLGRGSAKIVVLSGMTLSETISSLCGQVDTDVRSLAAFTSSSPILAGELTRLPLTLCLTHRLEFFSNSLVASSLVHAHQRHSGICEFVNPHWRQVKRGRFLGRSWKEGREVDFERC